MPKLVPILFMCICLTFNCTNYIDYKILFDKYQGSVDVHISTPANIPYVSCTPNGKSYVLSTNLNNLDNLLKNISLKNVQGYTFFINDTNLSNITNRLGLQYYDVNQNEILAYSSLIPFSIDLDGKVYNTQIVQKSDQIVIGFPMILGSY